MRYEAHPYEGSGACCLEARSGFADPSAVWWRLWSDLLLAVSFGSGCCGGGLVNFEHFVIIIGSVGLKDRWVLWSPLPSQLGCGDSASSRGVGVGGDAASHVSGLAEIWQGL